MAGHSRRDDANGGKLMHDQQRLAERDIGGLEGGIVDEERIDQDAPPSNVDAEAGTT